MNRTRLAVIAMLALCGPIVAQGAIAQGAGAQEAGGLAIAGPGPGPGPLQPELGVGAPLRQTPADVASANPARARRLTHQAAISKVRGDAGFLAGFFQGQPLAASRQPPPEFLPPAFFTFIEAPLTVNTFGSPVSIDAGGDAAAPVINATDSPVAINTGSGTLEQNIDSAVNIAAGTGNVARQTVTRK